MFSGNPWSAHVLDWGLSFLAFSGFTFFHFYSFWKSGKGQKTTVPSKEREPTLDFQKTLGNVVFPSIFILRKGGIHVFPDRRKRYYFHSKIDFLEISRKSILELGK